MVHRISTEELVETYNKDLLINFQYLNEKENSNLYPNLSSDSSPQNSIHHIELLLEAAPSDRKCNCNELIPTARVYANVFFKPIVEEKTVSNATKRRGCGTYL